MTISSGEPLSSGPYTGNGSGTVYDFDFQIYEAAELLVTTETAAGVQTDLVRGTDYTVAPRGGSYPSTGTITLTTPLAAGTTLVIRPAIEQTQLRAFSNQGRLSLPEVEAAFDKLTSLIRMAYEQLLSVMQADGFGNVDFEGGFSIDGFLALAGQASAPGTPVDGLGRLFMDSGGRLRFIANEGGVVSDFTLNDAANSIVMRSDDFVGDGTTTVFTLGDAPININNLFLFVDGVLAADEDFTLAGDVVTFAVAPTNGADIEARRISAVEVRENFSSNITLSERYAGNSLQDFLDQRFTFENVAALLADTAGYAATTTGAEWRTRDEGFTYVVLPLGATEPSVQTAGGVLLKAMPVGNLFYGEQFGAVGDAYDGNATPTDDTAAFEAALFEMARINQQAPAYVDDRGPSLGVFPAPTKISGMTGKVYGISRTLFADSRHSHCGITDASFKAIGTGWAPDQHMIARAGLQAGYFNLYNVQLWCDEKASGVNSQSFWYMERLFVRHMAHGGRGVTMSGVKSILANPDIKEWTIERRDKFYDSANYGAVGLWFNGIDHRILGGEIGWCHKLIHDEAGTGIFFNAGAVNTRFIGTHIFNGMNLFADYNTDGTTRAANPGGTPSPGRIEPIGFEKLNGPGYASVLFHGCYMDNCRFDLYDDDGVAFYDCDWNSNDEASNTDQTEWIRNYAGTAGAENKLVVRGARGGVTTLPKKLCVWLPNPDTGDDWAFAADKAQWEDSPENLVDDRKTVTEVSHGTDMFVTSPRGLTITGNTSSIPAQIAIRDMTTNGWGYYGIQQDQLVISSPSGTARLVNNVTGDVEAKFREGGMELRPRSGAPSAPPGGQVDGLFYYDNVINSFRFHEDGAWKGLGDSNGFTSRSAFAAAITAGRTWADGVTVIYETAVGVAGVVARSGATDLPGLPGFKLIPPAQPEHFAENTIPLNTDMTVAAQAALDYGKNNRVIVSFPDQYRVTDTLFMDGLGVIVEGVGSQSVLRSLIIVDQLTGPGIHVSGSRNTIRNMRISGSSARRNAAKNKALCGILTEPPDTPDTLMSDTHFENLIVDDHAGTGMVFTQVSGVYLDRCIVRDCRRHALAFGNYDESERVNRDIYTGILQVEGGRYTADGHRFLVGEADQASSNPGSFRCMFSNVDDGGGPEDPLSFTPALVGGDKIHARNVSFVNMAFSGDNNNGPAVIVGGEFIEFGPACRYLRLDTSPYAMKIISHVGGNATNNITIMSPQVVTAGTGPTSGFYEIDDAFVGPVPDDAVTFFGPDYDLDVASTADVFRSRMVLTKGLSLFQQNLFSVRSAAGTRFNVEDARVSMETLVKTGRGPTLEIASGAVDITHSFHLIDTEASAASDNLSTINILVGSLEDGDRLTLRTLSNLRDVTVDETGNINCQGTPITLSTSSHVIELIYDGVTSKWIVTSVRP